MRHQLILRNVVCLTENVSPSDFDVGEFAETLGLGTGEDTMRLQNISVTEWKQARLQVVPERLQLGFKPPADGDLVRGVVDYFLSRCDDLAPGKAVGFNAAMQFVLEEGESDPSENVVNASSLAEALDGKDGRGGFALVYHDDLSRWWVELTPQPEQANSWTFDFNRHFNNLPDRGADRNVILDWFAAIEKNLLAQFETICGGATD